MQVHQYAAFFAFSVLAAYSPIQSAEVVQPMLTVTGNASLQYPADQLEIQIGVASEAASAENALEENNRRMQAVVQALEKLGLKKEEFSTGRFSIIPTYTPQPKNPPENWRSTINGYQVFNQLAIKTDRIEKAGELIDLVSQAGANTIENINFSLKNSLQYRGDAITAATKQAIEDAKVLAQASSTPLGRIIRIDLVPEGPIAYQGKMMLTARAVDTSTPIEAGNVEVRATVTLVYSLMQED